MRSSHRAGLSIVLLSMTLAVAVRGAESSGGPLAAGMRAFEARRYVEARRFFEPYVESHPRDAAALHWLGRTLYALGDYEAAIEPLEAAAELSPRNADHFYWLGRAYGRAATVASTLQRMGFAKKLGKAYERAVALDPAHLDARAELVQFYLLAPAMMGGSVDEARKHAAEIARRDASRGAIARASISVNQGKPADAVRELEEAIRKSNGDSRVRMALGGVLQSQEKWDEAFAVYDAILTEEPDHWDALYQVGKTGALSGRHLDRAVAALRRYVAHTPGPDSPRVASAHFRLGMVLEKKGDRAGAKSAYQAALRLDPKQEEAKKALAKLK